MILTPAATARASMSASAAGWTSARNAVGPTTKIHALVDSLGNPVEMMLTPGQAHDLTCTAPLLEECDPEALIGDTAYDADAFIDTLTEREITPVIPPCDFALYCERNLVERFFNKLKHFRALSPPATTNLPEISSPESSSPPLSSSSTEDRL
jgi:transposase